MKRLASIPGEYFTDGGLEYNCPGPVALMEAQNLFPGRPEPIFLSAGCGRYVNERQGHESWFQRSCVHRLHKSHMKSLRADLQYKRHFGASTNFNRIDLDMGMEKPALDQVDALPRVCKMVESRLISDPNFYESQVVPTAYLWTASMFCFEFLRWPSYHEGRWRCDGYIFCRYPDRQKLIEQLREKFSLFGRFVIDGHSFEFEFPTEVKFSLSSLEEIFKISLHRDEQRANISGFPNTAMNILKAQIDTQRGQAPYRRKRKCEEEITLQPYKRNRS